MRLISCVLFAALCNIIAFPAEGVSVFSEDFEDGSANGWYTWTSQGITPNVVGPGFTMTVQGAPYAWSGTYGLNLYQDWTETGANHAEVQIPSTSGLMTFECDVRPYVLGGINNAFFVSLGEVSGLVSENGSFLSGVAFSVNGIVSARGSTSTDIGSYTPGEWCHVLIVLDTATDLFDVTVSGPGVTGVLTANNVPLRQPANAMNYILIFDNGVGEPNSHGIDNASVTTPTTEACCFPFPCDGDCRDLTPEYCIAVGGSPRGPGTSCATYDCAMIVACCFPDGLCDDLPYRCCQNVGGVPQLNGSTCAETMCDQPPSEACCFADGSCTDVPSDLCLAQGGTPQGAGTDCATVFCPGPPESGACCYGTNCIEGVTLEECEAVGGQWQGAGTTCLPNPCVTATETKNWGTIKGLFR